MNVFFGPFLITFTSLFVALDIIGTVPIYLSLTKDMSAGERKEVVDRSMGVALIVAILFMALGQVTFKHIGISIDDFKIAGGLILLLISLADLVGGPQAVHGSSSGSTGVVPLAVPLISGPAVLTTLLLQSGSVGYLVTVSALFLNYLLAWQILRHCDKVTKWIGKDGTIVLSKIAALLLAAIAVAMIRSGIFSSLAEFVRSMK
ncbi:MAG: MarC family protein [Cryobacterium sp.]|nr:MarC family protein [Oligoflexia bacterium]